MTREHFEEEVIGHLVDISSGRCSITADGVRARDQNGDRAGAEILMGLLCLHGDLECREQQRAAAVADLQKALDQVSRQNEELRNGIWLARAYAEVVQTNQALEQARTEQSRAVEALTRSNTELEQFAYVASHDL